MGDGDAGALRFSLADCTAEKCCVTDRACNAVDSRKYPGQENELQKRETVPAGERQVIAARPSLGGGGGRTLVRLNKTVPTNFIFVGHAINVPLQYFAITPL